MPTKHGRRRWWSSGSARSWRPAPSALEQPVPHAEVEALAEIRPRLGRAGDARRIALRLSRRGYAPSSDRTADLFNVRLSKCGGIVPTLRIVALAQRSGLGLQLGCHPGETGLLSAAGRHVAAMVRGPPMGRGLVRPARPGREPDGPGHLGFFPMGFAPPLRGPGLGVEVDPRGARADDRPPRGDPV